MGLDLFVVEENFEDLPSDACTDAALLEAKRWQRFLHDDDEHIKEGLRAFANGFGAVLRRYKHDPPHDTLPPNWFLCSQLCQVVRGFQSGRREFRTLHAMYRSETGGPPPYHGLHQETDAWAPFCGNPVSPGLPTD